MPTRSGALPPCLMPALFVALLVLSGCATVPGPAPDAGTPPTLLERTAATVPPLGWNATDGVDWWESFVAATPKRDIGLPNNGVARALIAATLSAAGYSVETRHYLPSQLAPAAAVGQGAADAAQILNVVVAVRNGTDTTHAIAVGAHYDTQQATLYGAYDNGAGTAAAVQTCVALAAVPTNRTLLCLLFDGEEEGTLGSLAFLADNEGRMQWTLDLYLGFDMTGLNWPGKDPGPQGTWRLFNWVGDEFAPDLFPFVNGTLHDVLGYPETGAAAFPFNDRNSDEATFKAAHIPTIRYAGGRTAGSYPEYHKPGDTVEYVLQFAGGRAAFERGFGAVVATAYTQALMFDATSLAEIRAATPA